MIGEAGKTDSTQEDVGWAPSEELCAQARGVAAECRKHGAALTAVADVLEACASREIVKSKYVSIPQPFTLEEFDL
jgi:hypothetical protein